MPCDLLRNTGAALQSDCIVYVGSVQSLGEALRPMLFKELPRVVGRTVMDRD